MRHRRARCVRTRTGVHAAPRPVVRRADVAGVAPVREEGDYEKRYDELQRFSPKPAVSRPARRGGRDAGAPVAQATGDASPIVERPKWGGKYDDDGLRVSRYDFAYIVPKSNKSHQRASPSRGGARTKELSTPPPRTSVLSPANEMAKSWERNLRRGARRRRGLRRSNACRRGDGAAKQVKRRAQRGQRERRRRG